MTTTKADSERTAVRAELADTRNWLDQRRAAPPAVVEAFGLIDRVHGDLAMVRSHIPFSHFNMVLTLGCPATPTLDAWAAIERFYGDAEHWVVTNEHTRPDSLGTELRVRGYEPVETWDRILCHDGPIATWQQLGAGAELVDAANATAWSDFVVATYGMPPLIADWLQALVGRPGWLHAVLREGGRPDGTVVMARSAYIDGDWVWLGIDAPIPGVMAGCFDDDRVVSAALLAAAARLGARHAVTDIEAPNDDRDGPAYGSWGALGFEPAYRRVVHHRPARA